MEKKTFSRYEVFIITVLTLLQFTIVLDFMVLSPLGAILMPVLKITPTQFGLVVSAYAFSAGAAGLLAAGFADRFDRKKLLLFFYAGFIIGTALCAMAPDYQFLLIARVVTGLFGGVIGAVSFAIITDLFAVSVRGRVMGFVQMAFASSQVLGIPVGLYCATRWGWHSPFALIVAVSLIVGVLIVIYMKPVNAHLQIQSDRNPLQHFGKIIAQPIYQRAFAGSVLLATGGYMLMPFASAFSVNNLGLTLAQLPLLYMITGICSMISAPVIGKLSDAKGHYKVFAGGSILSIILVLVYTQLGVTSLWLVTIISVFMFAGVYSRIIASSALISAVPQPADRGAFMGINSSLQQISGGVATLVAGLVVVQTPAGILRHYDILGYVVSVATVITMALIYTIHLHLAKQKASAEPAAVAVPVEK